MDLTTTPDQLDGDQLDALDGARLESRPADLATHAGAVLYQARMLTLADVLDCGPGIASALDELAEHLDALTVVTARPDLAATEIAADLDTALRTAAADLVDVAAATAAHRARVDARPATRRALDGEHEMYPRDVFTVAPRYSHADRRAAFLGSVDLMAEHLERMGP